MVQISQVVFKISIETVYKLIQMKTEKVMFRGENIDESGETLTVGIAFV
jgi:hypothetical protein